MNIDPANPSLPLSTPPDYSRELVRELGYYYTPGHVEDTHALTAGVLDADEYQQQRCLCTTNGCDSLSMNCSVSMMLSVLYFSTLDLSSHVFWRAIDPKHPLFTPELAESHGEFIRSLYHS